MPSSYIISCMLYNFTLIFTLYIFIITTVNHLRRARNRERGVVSSSEKLIILFLVQVDERSLGICMLKDLSVQKISIQMALFLIQNTPKNKDHNEHFNLQYSIKKGPGVKGLKHTCHSG